MDVEFAQHPENDQLVAFGLGKLAPSEATEIAKHLDHCRSCAETVLNLQDDTFVELVRQAPTAPKPAGENSLLLVEERSPTHATLNDASCPASDRSEVLELPLELRNHLRYKIMEVIGRGGMGDVYKAQHKLMNRPVALKVIRPELVQNEASVQRFHREVQVAARLHHPNVVTSYDAEQIGNFHILVMEFVDGVDLDKVVREKGTLPVLEACAYIRQAAEGLQCAYELGMVHRDIKPHNLMVGREGGLKILDFGLASLAAEMLEENLDPAEGHAEAQPPQLTVPGTMMGTPDYIAPEQARDAHRADIRADIYSLGCTFYTLLAGRAPFSVGSSIDRISAHCRQTASPLSLFRDDVPAEVEAILQRMMAKDPAHRYQKPADVAAALEPILRLAAKPAQEPTREPEPATQPRRSRTATFTAVTACFFALLAAAVVFYLQTNYGVVRVEVADESLNVLLNGRTIEMADGETPLSIRAGDQRLIVRRGDFEFATKEFELQRGTEVALKVQLLTDDLVVFKDGKLFAQKTLPNRQQPDEAGKISLVRTFEGHQGPASGLAVSANGRLALSGSGYPSELGDQTVRLWEVSTGDELWIKTVPFNVRSVALSPDGRLAAAAGEGDKIWLWSTRDGKEAGDLQSHEATVESLAFSQDGRLLLSGHGNGLVVLHSVAEQKELQRFTGHPNQVKGLAFLHDGQHVVSAGFSDKAIRVWDIATGNETTRFESATEIVQALALSPDGTHLVSGGAGGLIQAWDVESGKEVWRANKRLECRIVHVAFLPDGKHVVSGDSDANLDVWRINEEKPLASVHQPSGVVWGLGVLDGRHVLSSGGTIYRKGSGFRHPSGDYSLRLWRLPVSVQTSEQPQMELTRIVRPFTGHRARIHEVKIAPNGEFAVSVSEDGNAIAWELATGRKIQQFTSHFAPVYSIDIASDNRTVATGDRDGNLLLWDASTGEIIRRLDGHRGPVSSVCFAPDGKHLASGGGDQKVRLWDYSSGRATRSLDDPHGQVREVVYSPDGRRIAAVGTERKLRVWDAETGELLQDVAMEDQLWTLAWSPDMSTIACSLGPNASAAIHLLNLKDERVVRRLPLAAGCWGLTYTADGQFLISTSMDERIIVWDSQSGQQVGSRSDPSFGHLSLSSDGRTLLTGGTTLGLWQLPDSESGRRALGGFGITFRDVVTMGRERAISLPMMLLIIVVLLAIPFLLGVIFTGVAFLYGSLRRANEWSSEIPPVRYASSPTRGGK